MDTVFTNQIFDLGANLLFNTSRSIELSQSFCNYRVFLIEDSSLTSF